MINNKEADLAELMKKMVEKIPETPRGIKLWIKKSVADELMKSVGHEGKAYPPYWVVYG